jgi:hypothetical protein
MKGVLRAEADRRREGERSRVLFGGKIVYGAKEEFSFNCHIKNRSETGARLTLPAGGVVPDRFQLLDMRTGEVLDARVAWRRHPEVGVVFAAKSAAADAGFHLRQLWLPAA